MNNRLKLSQKIFRLNIWVNLMPMRHIRLWSNCPREMREGTSHLVFKTTLDKTVDNSQNRKII